MKLKPDGPITLSTDIKDIAVLVAIAIFVLLLVGCRTTPPRDPRLPVPNEEHPPSVQPPALMPPVPPGYKPPAKQRMMATVPDPEPLIVLPPPPLRIRYPAFPGHRQWNPHLGKSVTTTNTGLYGFDWVAPVEGERWYLHTSTNLVDWSQGIPIGDRYQSVLPLDPGATFFKVVPAE